jgi:sec-independent protein translocase protein TatA
MFGIGFPELLVILALALVVIGPKRLPDIAKALGRAMAEFKRATDDFKHSLNEETQAADIRRQILDAGRLRPSSPATELDPSAPTAEPAANPEETATVEPPPLGPVAATEAKRDQTDD